jgi:hypothetical protein
MLQEKALTILRIFEAHSYTPEGRALYERACKKYSEKAVLAKGLELVGRGYADYGTSVRGAWLTEKGKKALLDASLSQAL